MSEEFQAEAHTKAVEASVFLAHEQTCGEQTGAYAVAVFYIRMQAAHAQRVYVDAFLFDVTPDVRDPCGKKNGRLIGQVGTHIIF